jgi:hypothetical protein
MILIIERHVCSFNHFPKITSGIKNRVAETAPSYPNFYFLKINCIGISKLLKLLPINDTEINLVRFFSIKPLLSLSNRTSEGETKNIGRKGFKY